MSTRRTRGAAAAGRRGPALVDGLARALAVRWWRRRSGGCCASVRGERRRRCRRRP